jgi:hypothetical protein
LYKSLCLLQYPRKPYQLYVQTIISTTLIQNSKKLFPLQHSITIFPFTLHQIYFPLSFLPHFFFLCIFSFVNFSNIYYFFFSFCRKKNKCIMKFLPSSIRYDTMIIKLTFLLVHISSSFFLSFISIIFLWCSITNTQRKRNCCTWITTKIQYNFFLFKVFFNVSYLISTLFRIKIHLYSSPSIMQQGII